VLAAQPTTTATWWGAVSIAGPDVCAPIDANGNLTSDGTRTFEWDARNQLVAVNVGTLRSEFTYDGEQRRVRIVEKDGAVVQSDTKVIWCETGICEERAADGTTVTRRAFALGEQAAGVARFFAADHLGSVGEVTNGSGTVLARYGFDPWGRRILLSGTNVTSTGYTGHQWHSTAGMWLAQYRAYESDLGRWISEDPIGLDDGPNLYAYVANNPFQWIDPDGLQRQKYPRRCLQLRLVVLLACKVAPTRCYDSDSCTTIKAKIALKQGCIAAQKAFSAACHPNNQTHQQRIRDEENGIKRCREILDRKEKNCECK
jgi:RHS repeat-associated protein